MASKISKSELPKAQKELIKKLDMKFIEGFEGIHGYIVHLEGVRMDKEQMQILASSEIVRWIEPNNDMLTIGF